MGREVVYIELVTENCEVIRLDRQHIGRFHMKDVSRSILRRASNSVSGLTTAEEMFLQISAKANVISAYEDTWDDQTTLPFDRILENTDICAVEITYEDGSSEYILVKWGEDDWTNEYQTVSINENTGDLYIVISGETTAEEHFEYLLQEENADVFWRTIERMEALK
ncbi:hypothetical protein CTV96_09425 [Bacillus altitudinis]|uniref:hypothetical protein n=1 Tax=Bacillus altitudinis TaxID=293387 RepID=UPI000C23874A|nr:hypothetical protein [Bacillus altitudinis]PJI12358.1 hypothetical protein CTV96_09425 [Bacillus altitudinis]PKQ85628.1 hypothetical protein CTV98_007670 [Bacillus altitudinis]